MERIARLPLFLHLGGLFAAAMLLPGLQAWALGMRGMALGFAQDALAFGLILTFFALVVPPSAARRAPVEVLLTILGAVTLLPLALALPLHRALPDTGLFNAWWEMVSCLTTTGASLYDPRFLEAPLHLWRGLVGWMGGLLMLAGAATLLAPLGVGGFELTAPPPQRHGGRVPPPGKVGQAMRAVTPVYAGFTAALWLALVAAGGGYFPSLMRAMGTLSTSGIAAVTGPVGASVGLTGEALLLLFLIPALSRRFWPGGDALTVTRRWRDDPELRLAALTIAAVVVVILARAFVFEIDREAATSRRLADGLAAAWGAVFNGMSFLTTTGWTSVAWEQAREWSGISAPGLMLAGLAIMGGGVATTASGVKLLRVHALALHSAREMERIVHPASVAGGGTMMRHLRSEGARLAFVVFMLFALSLTAVILALSMGQVALETATMLAVSALTNTGPLASSIPLSTVLEGTAGSAGAPWQGWAGLSIWGKSVTAAAMIVGRLETLAILALLSPAFWRR